MPDWRTTFYAPGAGGNMEGPFATSRKNPITGRYDTPFTLDDVRLGKSPWVTVASDPSRYGQTLNLGSVTYRSPIDQQSYTLPNVQGYVHDTGSAFQGRPDKIDIAQGDFRGWNPRDAENFVAGGNSASPEGRPMANTLMDMMQPQQSFTDRLGNMSNSLIGLGMGMLQPYNPWAGTNAFTNALQGYQVGSALDQRSAAQRQQLATQAYDRLWREQEAARAQANADRSFGLQQQQFEQGNWQKVKDPETEEEYFYNPRSGQVMRPGGQSATASAGTGAYGGGAAVPFTGGGPMGTGTGGAFPQGTAQAAGPSKDAVVMPNGQVVEPPPGLPPSARKEWRKHVLTIQADAAAGKSTEQQSNSALFASRMEIAERTLGGGADTIGTHPGYHATQKVPFGLGNYAQSDAYQSYRIAKDNFINSYLRRISGATIRDDEFVREEKNFFPQPGDGPKQIEEKRVLRASALANMKRGAGPGYVSPQLDRAPAPAATGAASSASSPADALRQELIRRGVNPDQ